MAVGPYLRRRWRAVGLVLVLMSATALGFLITDRGHDARWVAPLTGAEITAAAPDGSHVYAVTRLNGTVRDLVAFDAAGAERWRAAIPGGGPDAVLEATDGLVAVATAAPPLAAAAGADRVPPGARLLVLDAADGRVRLDEALPFTARALAVEPGLLAVAVQLPSERYPVLLWKNLTAVPAIALNESVETLDVEAGTLALGTAKGRIVVRSPNGTEVVNTTRGYAVLQVRLDATASFLAAGGKEFQGAGGRVEFYRLKDPVPDLPRWENLTGSEVRTLDLSRDGSRLLALASPPGAPSLLLLFDTASGSRPLHPALSTGGVVHRQGTSTASGARLSPDGKRVAFGTLTGPIVVYDFSSAPTRLWQHDATGTTSLVFPANRSDLLVGDVSYDPRTGTDRIFLIDVDSEPLSNDLWRAIPLALLLEALVGAVVLGVGFLRRPAR